MWVVNAVDLCNYLMIFWFLIGLLSFGKTKDLICFIVTASLISFGSLPRATDAKIGHQRWWTPLSTKQASYAGHDFAPKLAPMIFL